VSLRKNFKFLYFVAFTILGFRPESHAGFVGSFDQARNFPGYVTFEQKSVYYTNHLYTTKQQKLKDGIERRSASALLHSYVTEQGLLNVQAINKRVIELRNKEQGAFLVYCQDKRKNADAGFCSNTREQILKSSIEGAKLVSKWKDENVSIALRFSISELERSVALAGKLSPIIKGDELNSIAWQDVFEALMQGLEVDEAVDNIDYSKVSLGNILGYLKGPTTPLMITERPEALNLELPAPLNSGTRRFLSPDELKSKGYDLSLLDPVQSGLWRRPNTPISQFNTTNYNGLNASHVAPEILSVGDEVSLEYEKPANGGTTPKINVAYTDSVTAKEKKYKLKFPVAVPMPSTAGSLGTAFAYFRSNVKENQTEFVANNLAAALGFTVDPTYFKSRAKLYLLKEPTLKTDCKTDPGYAKAFENAYVNFYEKMNTEGVQAKRKEKWDYSVALGRQQIQTDAQGCQYILMTDISLELRSDLESDIEIGGFIKENFNRGWKREFRAINLFYAWINDIDARDVNAEIKILANQNKIVYSAADMGGSFGWYYGKKNLPNLFKADLVDSTRTELGPDGSASKLVLTYHNERKNAIWDAISLNDAKWFARLLGQLTHQQIRSSFDRAGYPPVVAEVYAQKLLRRRDQLVKYLGLEGTTVTANGTGQKVVLKPLSDMTNPATYRATECPECFQENGELKAVPGKLSEEWTDSFKNLQEGTRTREFVEVAAFMLLNQGALNPLNGRLQRLQIEKCMFFDGVFVGIDSFMPAQYVVENPNKDPEHPFWRLEVYRAGFDAGASSNCKANWGVIIGQANVDWKVQLGRTFEVVKITPIKASTDTLKNLPKVLLPTKNFGELFRRLSREKIEGLNQGEIVVATNYATTAAGIKVDPGLITTGGVTPQVSLAFDRTVTKRLILAKDDENKIVANWEDLKKRAIGGDLALKVFILRFPIFGKSVEKLSQIDRTYRFDLSDQAQKVVFENNLELDLPTGIDSKLIIQDRSLESKTSKTFLSALGFKTNRYFSTKTTISLNDANGTLSQKLISAKKSKVKRSGEILGYAKTIDQVTSEATSTLDGDLFLKVRVLYTKHFATRDDFKKLKAGHLRILPADFVLFDASHVSHYLGTLKLDSEILISKQGLAQAFGSTRSREDLCKIYGEQIKVDDVAKFCNLVVVQTHKDAFKIAEEITTDPIRQLALRIALLGARSFIDGFGGVLKRFVSGTNADIKSKDGEKKIEELLGGLVNLIEKSSDRVNTVRTLMQVIGDQNVQRTASLESSVGGLPGQSLAIELNKASQGQFVATEIQSARDVRDMAENMTDYIMRAISGYLYDFANRERLAKSLKFPVPQ
jgi:hypothetical protein